MTVITPICVFSRTQLFKPAHFHILHLTHKVQVFTWRVSNFYRTRLYISSHCRVCTIAVLLSKPACTGGTSKDCVIPMPFILISHYNTEDGWMNKRTKGCYLRRQRRVVKKAKSLVFDQIRVGLKTIFFSVIS